MWIFCFHLNSKSYPIIIPHVFPLGFWSGSIAIRYALYHFQNQSIPTPLCYENHAKKNLRQLKQKAYRIWKLEQSDNNPVWWKHILDEGRCIYADNWYSSVELLDELGKHSTDVIGTVWKDHKALPKDAVNAKLNKGETKTAYSPQYNAMCMQWNNKHDVCMHSSCIPDENVSVIGRGKEVTVPLVINIYNNMMGGVDWLIRSNDKFIPS